MKEASGEANMTVITIVLIGLIAAIATPLITNLLRNSSRSSCCQSNGGVWQSGKCYAACTANANGTKSCTGTGSTVC